MTPRRYVLDANALISFLENRPGPANRVRQLLDGAFRADQPLLLSAVNWGEVFYITLKLHGQAGADEVETRLEQLPIVVLSADRDRATRAAALKQKYNLGYADSFAAELAMERGAWLVTADPEFAKIGKSLFVYQLPRYAK
jgi:predicted nucleic acid-binding protein